MKKKIFTALALLASINIGVFAQQTQRLTFTDMRLDGTIIGTVTVNAFHAGWSQQQISIENGMHITRETFKYGSNEWTPWQLMGREPTHVLSIRLAVDFFLQEYYRYPKRGVRVHLGGGLQGIRMHSIPTGRSSPLWWNDDGRSFFAFYELWIITP